MKISQKYDSMTQYFLKIDKKISFLEDGLKFEKRHKTYSFIIYFTNNEN